MMWFGQYTDTASLASFAFWFEYCNRYTCTVVGTRSTRVSTRTIGIVPIDTVLSTYCTRVMGTEYCNRYLLSTGPGTEKVIWP